MDGQIASVVVLPWGSLLVLDLVQEVLRVLFLGIDWLVCFFHFDLAPLLLEGFPRKGAMFDLLVS